MLKIYLSSVENQASQDFATSVNGASLQDIEVFFFFNLSELLGF